MQENAKNDLAGYARHYDEAKLWCKLSQMPRSSMLLVLEKALLLRELMMDRSTPVWVRGLLLGALGYFLLPLDVVPDYIPTAGYMDDVAMLSLVLANLDRFVTDGARERARERMARMTRTTTRGGKP